MPWPGRPHIPRLPLAILLLTATFAALNLKLVARIAWLSHDGHPDLPGRRAASQTDPGGEALLTPLAGTLVLNTGASASSAGEQHSRPPEHAKRASPLHVQEAQKAQQQEPRTAQFAQQRAAWPSVTAVHPRIGPIAGGTTLRISGQGFGAPGTLIQARIGPTPCLETRVFTNASLHCLLPPGHGTNLPVTVRPCQCGSTQPDADTSEPAHQPSLQAALFSFTEDLIAKVAAEQPHLMPSLQPGATSLPLRMTQSQLVGKYEVQHADYVRQRTASFMLEPGVAEVLPAEDFGGRYETCALVGKSGSLLGSGLGPLIDSHDAVFRIDNAPTAAKHAEFAGLKTTFVMLADDWAQELLSTEEVGGQPVVHRWWANGSAAVVMWGAHSQYSYVQLLGMYPGASVMFLSRDLVTFTQALARRVQGAAMAHLQGDQQPLSAGVSSLMLAAVLATQVCTKVDVYGVLPRCSRPANNEADCRKTTYFDDFEPSPTAQALQQLEQWLLMYLSQQKSQKSVGSQKGILNLDTPEWVVAGADGSLSPGGVADLAARIGQDGVCDERMCQPQCSGHGKYVDGGCACEAAFRGPDCSENRLLASAARFLKGISLRFDGPLLLSQAMAVADEQGSAFHIPLPDHNNQHRQGALYALDREMLGLLPPDDQFLISTLASHSGGRHPPFQNGTSIAARLFDFDELPDAALRHAGTLGMLGRCALVGNSGRQLHSSYGADIDAHDVVIRFNQGPTRGHEDAVGTRTDMEFVNKAWMSQLLEGVKATSETTRISRYDWDWRSPGNALAVFEMFDPASFAYRETHLISDKEAWWRASYTRFRRQFPDHPLLALSPQVVIWAHQRYGQLQAQAEAAGLGTFTGEKPMSGFYAVLLSLQVCEQVDIYGFTPYQESDRLDPLAPRYHYFDAAFPRPSSHSFDLADYVYQLLANVTGNIRVFD